VFVDWLKSHRQKSLEQGLPQDSADCFRFPAAPSVSNEQFCFLFWVRATRGLQTLVPEKREGPRTTRGAAVSSVKSEYSLLAFLHGQRTKARIRQHASRS
jgi:hypothetical protein